MQGYIVYFNKEEGYGFIGSDAYEKDIFVHISDIQKSQYLTQGQSVEFTLTENKKGLKAINVIPGTKRTSPYLLFGIISLFMTLVLFIYASKYLDLLIAYLLAINLSTFVLYGYDKYISSRDKLRIPEVNLQALALLGGSPAALAAQKFFRHKTIKGSFQVVYWLIVVVQVGLILWLK